MKTAFVAFLVLAASAYVFFTRRHKLNTVQKDMPYGPFVIRATASTHRELNMNYGMVNRTSVAYSILHRGKIVEFPSNLQNNTGMPYVWSVMALPDAPEPTLLAGSQSLYLIYLKNEAVQVEPLVVQGSDFASVQFLDSQNGQPGAFKPVYGKNSPHEMDKLDSLQGGRLLMISEHGVLDVKTRAFKTFNKDNNSIDNYSPFNNQGALAFAPDQRQIVFRAAFQSWNTETENLPDSEHGLIAYDYQQDQGYVVPFDDTDTRSKNPFDMDLDWLQTYFDWQQKPDGSYRLQVRKLSELPPWTGSYSASDGYYTLYPVKAGMLPVFTDFVLEQMGWSKSNILKDETGEYTGHSLLLGTETFKMDIRFDEAGRKLTFSKHLYDEANDNVAQAVKKISAAFDAELKSGKHQSLFGRVINETKQIRGM